MGYYLQEKCNGLLATGGVKWVINYRRSEMGY